MAAALALATALALASPGLASAAQSFSVTSPTGFPAGGDPTYTRTTTLDTSAGTPSKVTVSLAPGVLASVAANASCVTGAPQYTSACQIGSGSASTAAPGLAFSFSAYLVAPPSSADVAGIDIVTDLPGGPVTHAAVQLVQTATGNVASMLSLDLSSLGAEAQFITGLTLTVDGTLGGKPFNRMPTNCSPSASTLTVVYANGTETTKASPDFAPTGCGSLPYAPQLSGQATRDTGDRGAGVTTTVAQGADEAASSSTTLQLPFPTLATNLASLALQNTSTPVGSATADTPLLPAPLVGQVLLTGTPLTPSLTVRFPPPSPLTLTGTLNLNSNSVTIGNVPDVPLTKLVVTLNGGAEALLVGTCAPRSGTLHGSFTSQGGTTVTASQPLTVSGCPGAPTVSGVRLSGLASGRPSLGFALAAGVRAPMLKSFTVSLTGGLAFQRKGLARHVAVSAAHKLRLAAGKLTVTLVRPADRVAVRISSPALLERPLLRRRSRHHAVKGLRLGLSIADAAKAVTPLRVSV